MISRISFPSLSSVMTGDLLNKANGLVGSKLEDCSRWAAKSQSLLMGLETDLKWELEVSLVAVSLTVAGVKPKLKGFATTVGAGAVAKEENAEGPFLKDELKGVE